MNRYYSLEHNTDANVSIHCHTNECRTQVAWLNDYAPMSRSGELGLFNRVLESADSTCMLEKENTGQAYFFESYTVASFNCGTKFPS
ncbi:hypothetical protein KY284_028286 [Solanum tuberosum]|nr:hypothetical protein KY284_028286 [Solanum tuberosum]